MNITNFANLLICSDEVSYFWKEIFSNNSKIFRINTRYKIVMTSITTGYGILQIVDHKQNVLYGRSYNIKDTHLPYNV